MISYVLNAGRDLDTEIALLVGSGLSVERGIPERVSLTASGFFVCGSDLDADGGLGSLQPEGRDAEQ